MVISHHRLNRKIGKGNKKKKEFGKKGLVVLDDHGLDEKIGKQKEKMTTDLDEYYDEELVHAHHHNLNLLFLFFIDLTVNCQISLLAHKKNIYSFLKIKK